MIATLAAAVILWTPAHMTQTLRTLEFAAPSCKGIGVHHKTGFAQFRCSSGQLVLFTRPLRTGVCASLSRTGTCRPIQATLTTDPRMCGHEANECVEAAAELAARRHAGGPGGMWQGPGFDCTMVKPLVWTCPLSTTTYTVSFLRNLTAWTVNVTP